MKCKEYHSGCILVLILFIYSCENKPGKALLPARVLISCFQLDDTTLYLKISNETKTNIYIPEHYWANYTDNDDTIHLEGFTNPLYSTTYYYRYDSTLPFIFYTSKIFDGTKPDSVIEKTEMPSFNQFRVRPFKMLSVDSTSYIKLNFLIPRLTPIVKVVYYKKDFFTDDLGRNNDYTIGDFMSFESKNAKYVADSITLIYKDD